jgi:uncharacterized protein (TIGR02246 family)
MNRLFVLFAVLLFAICVQGQKYHPRVQAVRDAVEKWNSGYRALDPKRMSASIADELEFVNRFGQHFHIRTKDEYEQMWNWAFTNIYRGKPGPDHEIRSVRFVGEDVAVVQATATRTEPVIVSDGTKIPPFTQHATFVLVETKAGWRITTHNIHNQFPDPDKSGRAPWQTETSKN